MQFFRISCYDIPVCPGYKVTLRPLSKMAFYWFRCNSTYKTNISGTSHHILANFHQSKKYTKAQTRTAPFFISVSLTEILLQICASECERVYACIRDIKRRGGCKGNTFKGKKIKASLQNY